MIIKVYGELWSRDLVRWRSRQMFGNRRNKGRCNVWNQSGIYALYKNFELVYVGQAEGPFGKRLNQHQRDRFKYRWDSFSFFGICALGDHEEPEPASPIQNVTPGSLIKSLELMAILLTNAPLNRARGKFPDGAEKIRQFEPKKRDGKGSLDLDSKLKQLSMEIDKLRSELPTQRGRRLTAPDV